MNESMMDTLSANSRLARLSVTIDSIELFSGAPLTFSDQRGVESEHDGRSQRPRMPQPEPGSDAQETKRYVYLIS